MPPMTNTSLDPALLAFLQNRAMIDSEKLQMDAYYEWQRHLREPRYQEPKRLTRHGYKVYSQNDEDGILMEIIRRLGDKCPKKFIEFGVENGLQCNSLRLLVDGWQGLWIEGAEKYCGEIKNIFAREIAANKLTLTNGFVTKDNVNDLFTAGGMTGDIGMLCIDIDSNDIWVWEATTAVSPAIVIIEYNATWAPPLTLAQVSDPNVWWKGTNYFGASLGALEKIGRKKGYNLVGCCYAGMNAFFVREDLCGDKFHAPYTAMEHYEPARYWMRHLKAGHRPGFGEMVTV